MISYLSTLYDNSPRPRFLLGVGDPIDVRYGIEHGIDMFDCVLPTRNARHATVWVTGDQRIHLTNKNSIMMIQSLMMLAIVTLVNKGLVRAFTTSI